MLLFFMFLVLFISMLIGAVMFCVDIWKWSKRPEKYTTIHEDMQKDDKVKVKEVIYNAE